MFMIRYKKDSWHGNDRLTEGRYSLVEEQPAVFFQGSYGPTIA